jgi:hypothetical protein
MTPTATPAPSALAERPAGPPTLGFLTVLQDAGGYVGGYLVTNSWGRPLEFRLSSAVQPNRVQQVLYGPTLGPYVCADLIGKALVDKAGQPVQLLLTDREPVLELRQKVEAPVLWLAPPGTVAGQGSEVRPAEGGRGPLLCHPRYPGDASAARALLERLDAALDLAEPFQRIREAIGEARKLGVSR